MFFFADHRWRYDVFNYLDTVFLTCLIIQVEEITDVFDNRRQFVFHDVASHFVSVQLFLEGFVDWTRLYGCLEIYRSIFSVLPLLNNNKLFIISKQNKTYFSLLFYLFSVFKRRLHINAISMNNLIFQIRDES